MTTAQQDLITLAERLIRYFPKGTIDPLLDADIEIRQMARDAIEKHKVQVLDPAEAQQHQTENLVAVLMSGKTMEGADLQAVKDQLSTAAHGMTPAEAWKTGICIECRQPAEPKCHTPEGHGEYRISGLCEECFDKIFAEDETQGEEESRWPICPECLGSLIGEVVNDFSDADGNTAGTIRGIPSVCPECNLEFGVKSTEEVKPSEKT